MFCCTFYSYRITPWSARLWHRYRELSCKICRGIAFCIIKTDRRSTVHNLTAKTSGVRTNINDIIGCPHNILVMFNNDNSIA